MKITEGVANVWICHDDARPTYGCGYIGLYKPETDVSEFSQEAFRMRKCPGCRRDIPYHRTADQARIVVTKE